MKNFERRILRAYFSYMTMLGKPSQSSFAQKSGILWINKLVQGVLFSLPFPLLKLLREMLF